MLRRLRVCRRKRFRRRSFRLQRRQRYLHSPRNRLPVCCPVILARIQDKLVLVIRWSIAWHRRSHASLLRRSLLSTTGSLGGYIPLSPPTQLSGQSPPKVQRGRDHRRRLNRYLTLSHLPRKPSSRMRRRQRRHQTKSDQRPKHPACRANAVWFGKARPLSRTVPSHLDRRQLRATRDGRRAKTRNRTSLQSPHRGFQRWLPTAWMSSNLPSCQTSVPSNRPIQTARKSLDVSAASEHCNPRRLG